MAEKTKKKVEKEVKGKKSGAGIGIEGEKRIKRKKQEKQIKIFVVIMLALLVFIFVVYAFIQATLKFSYAGLEFEKVRQGDLVLYRTPVFPIFLREDPRELRDIGIEGRIILQRKVGIAGEKELLENCEDSTLAATTLAVFYGKTGLQPFSASTNKTEAEEFDIGYVECNLNANYSVIMLVNGEENRIKKNGECYVLEVKDCEVMDVSERFIVASYVHSRGIEI